MTLKEIIMARYEVEYKIQSYKGVSLLEWAVRWFKTSNDDFYNLENKITKNDVGGLQFIHEDMQENFLLKAKDTMYKNIDNA